MTIGPFRTAIAAILVGAALQTCPMLSARLLAHHSFSAEFDENKPVKVTGKVTSMRWSNPHAWIYVDVPGADGKVVNWAFETSAVNALYRQGWRKEDLPAGTVLVIDGWQARNGTPTANAYSITFPDGKRLFAGSPSGTAGTPTAPPAAK
ncbi:MAG TPA: DUF6152 family protein [Vicinamibacterales bacterium]|jgi:hypothetical protein|nr:DUF6152 family protein [Vicinamibacterales bacterium]